MNNNETLDETDRKILRILQRNSNLTVKRISCKTPPFNLSHVWATEAIGRDGYMKDTWRLWILIRLAMVLWYLCNIRLKQHSQELIQEFMDVVQNLEEITEVITPVVTTIFFIKVYAHDMKSYQQFMLNTLGTINCIGSLHSIFVIDETKNTHGVPISMLWVVRELMAYRNRQWCPNWSFGP